MQALTRWSGAITPSRQVRAPILRSSRPTLTAESVTSNSIRITSPTISRVHRANSKRSCRGSVPTIKPVHVGNQRLTPITGGRLRTRAGTLALVIGLHLAGVATLPVGALGPGRRRSQQTEREHRCRDRPGPKA